MFLKLTTSGANHNLLSWVACKHPGKLYSKDDVLAWFQESQDTTGLVITCEVSDYSLWNENTPGVDNYVTDRNYALTSIFSSRVKNSFRNVVSGTYNNTGPEGQDLAQVKFEQLSATFLPVVSKLPREAIIELWQSFGEVSVEEALRPSWLPVVNHVYTITVAMKNASMGDFLRPFLVLVPTMDNYSHFKPSEDQLASIEKWGAGWLEIHPKREQIKARFLRYNKDLIEVCGKKHVDVPEPVEEGQVAIPDQSFGGLSVARRHWMIREILKSERGSVVDAGCGSGFLTQDIQSQVNPPEMLAFDVSSKALQLAHRFCKNATVFFSSLTYPDKRLRGKDVFCMQEVIEHLTQDRLKQVEYNIFKLYRPKTVLITTPNFDANKFMPTLPTGDFRHRDHKFEWTTLQAQEWASRISQEYGYKFSLDGIGVHPVHCVAGSTGIRFERL
jgi:3' terminal RNA ribose 2'-O-methyltransferase Hen1